MKRRIETVVVMLMILSIVIPFGGCSKAGSQTGNTSTTDTSLTESTVPTYTPTPTPSPTPTPVPRLVEKVSFMDPEFYPENKDLPGYSEKKPSYRELYDEYGRIIELQDNVGGKIVYEYDDDGKLSRTYTSKNKSIVARTNYKYSEDGLLMEEDNEHIYAAYSYDSDGRLIETKYTYTNYTYPEPIDVAKTEYEYNESGLLKIEKNRVINEVNIIGDDTSFSRTRILEHAKMLESYGFYFSSILFCGNYVIEYTYDSDELAMVKANVDYGKYTENLTEGKSLFYEKGILVKSVSVRQKNDGSSTENCTETYEYNEDGCLTQKLTSWEDSVHKEAWCYEYDDNSMVLSETFYMSDEGSDEINYSSPKMRLLYKYYYE